MTIAKRGREFGTDTEPTVVRADNMTELWDKVNKKLLWAKKEQLSYASSLDTMISDCMGWAESCEFDLNIGKELWVTPSRWNTLIRQYVDPARLFAWLEGVKYLSTYNRGVNAMDMNPVQSIKVLSNPRANRRKWGGCMRMITYRAFPSPTITLFSRTSYLGYIGGLDMLLAHKLAELACDMIGEGLNVRDMKFRWFCDTWQFHGFKSMSYIFASKQDKLMRVKNWPSRKLGPETDYPTWKLVRNWWQRLNRQDEEGKLYEEMKYSAEKRIRRRYHAQMGIDQDSYLGNERRYDILDTPVELITLDRMLYKTPESRAIIRKEKEKKAKALVESLFDDEEIFAISLDEEVG